MNAFYLVRSTKSVQKPNLMIPSALFSANSAPVRVTYRDTDRMGHAYYSTYLVWFEIGRTDLLRQLGTTYRAWEEDHNVYLPVRECQIKYRIPAQYDDVLTVETHMVRLTKASVDFAYRVIRGSDDAVVAEGHTSHAFVDNTGKICRVAHKLMPQFFR